MAQTDIDLQKLAAVNGLPMLVTQKGRSKALCIESAKTDESENSRVPAASHAIKLQESSKYAIQEKLQLKTCRFTLQDTFAHIQKEPKMLDEPRHKLLSFKIYDCNVATLLSLCLKIWPRWHFRSWLPAPLWQLDFSCQRLQFFLTIYNNHQHICHEAD